MPSKKGSVDETHFWFSDPKGLSEQLRSAFAEAQGHGRKQPNGSFETVPSGIQGKVITDNGAVGVWAAIGAEKRAQNVVFYIVQDDRVVFEEFDGLSWSESEIVARADVWIAQKLRSTESG